METGAEQIATEVLRQDAENEATGCTTQQVDRDLDCEQLVLAALCYAAPPGFRAALVRGSFVGATNLQQVWEAPEGMASDPWPFQGGHPAKSPWPTVEERIAELRQAGAFLAREIDRLQALQVDPYRLPEGTMAPGALRRDGETKTT